MSNLLTGIKGRYKQDIRLLPNEKLPPTEKPITVGGRYTQNQYRQHQNRILYEKLTLNTSWSTHFRQVTAANYKSTTDRKLERSFCVVFAFGTTVIGAANTLRAPLISPKLFPTRPYPEAQPGNFESDSALRYLFAPTYALSMVSFEKNSWYYCSPANAWKPVYLSIVVAGSCTCKTGDPRVEKEKKKRSRLAIINYRLNSAAQIVNGFDDNKINIL